MLQAVYVFIFVNYRVAIIEQYNPERNDLKLETPRQATTTPVSYTHLTLPTKRIV